MPSVSTKNENKNMTVRPQQLIPHGMNTMFECLTRLEDEINQLEEALGQVLCPRDTVHPDEAGGAGIGHISSPMSQKLDTAVSILNKMELQVKDVRGRVEL